MVGRASRIEVREEPGPLVVVRWPVGAISDEELQHFIDLSRDHIARLGAHAVLHLGIRALGLSASQRKHIAEHANQSRESLSVHVRAAAVVAPSPILRGMITAMNWLAPPPFPQRVFAAEEVARAWLMEQLGTPPPQREAR
mgnify:CR=1 FL=1